MSTPEHPASAGPLSRLIAAHEKALEAGETPPDVPSHLQAEWDAARGCLALLGRADQREAAVRIPETFGRFHVRRVLGHGGFGIVFLADDPQLGRSVALKVPLLGGLLSDEMRRRFLHEAQAAARLQHPNIVAVHEAGEAGGVCFIVSAYCDGPTLEAWMRAQTALVPPREAAELVATLADAVQHAHQQAIVHRDLKPANVLLSVSREPPASALAGGSRLTALAPMITDFGLAKILDTGEGHMRTGAVVGTPAYMAPEQARGHSRDVDARTDVYALGAILYTLLAGRPPFLGRDADETLQFVLARDPALLAAVRSDVPRDLDTICRKCLNKEPSSRYASARQLSEDLHRFLGGRPIIARPTPAWEKAVKWGRRNPAWATLAIVLVLSLGTILGGIAWYTSQLQDTNQKLETAVDDGLKRERQVRRQLYAADMRHLFQHAWPRGDARQVLHMLDRHRPDDHGDDVRGFEWHYLRQLVHEKPLAVVRVHDQGMVALAFSPDGRLLATAGQDKQVKVWDSSDLPGKSAEVWPAATDVRAIAFSAEGRRLLRWCADGTVSARDAATGSEQILHRLSAGAGSAAFSPDGVNLATVHNPRTLRVFEVGTGKLLLDRQVRDSGGKPIPLAFFATDRAVASTSGAGAELHRPTEKNPSLALMGHPLLALTGARLREQLAAVDANRGVALVDRGAPRWFGGPSDRPGAAAFSADDRLLASTGTDGAVLLWDVEEGRLLCLFRGHSGSVCCLAFSPDGTRLAVGTTDGTVRLWAVPKENPEMLKPDLDFTGALAFSPDGKILLAGQREGPQTPRTMAVLDHATGRVLRRLPSQGGPRNSLAFSPDGRLYAEAGLDGVVRLRSPDTDEEVAALPGLGPAFRCVAWSPDGSIIGAGDAEGNALFWDGASRKRLGVPPRRPPAPILAIAFSTPVSMTLGAVGYEDGHVNFWKAPHPNLWWGNPMPTGGPEVSSLAFLDRGQRLLVKNAHELSLWNVYGERARVDPPMPAQDGPDRDRGWFSVSRDERFLATALNNSMEIVDIGPRRITQLVLDCDGDDTLAGVVHPRSRRREVAAVSRCGRLWLLDLGSGTRRCPTGQLPASVAALKFSPDGRTLLTGSGWCDPLGTVTTVFDLRRTVSILGKDVHHDSTSAPAEPQVRLWDALSGRPLGGLDEPHLFGASSLVPGPDGQVAACGIEGSVVVWELPARRQRARWFVGPSSQAEWEGWQFGSAVGAGYKLLRPEHGTDVAFAAWRSGPGRVVVGTSRGRVVQWTPDGGEERLLDAPWPEAAEVIVKVAYSAEGEFLAGACGTRICLWDARGEQSRVLETDSPVSSLAVAPDGRTLAAGCFDGVIRIWRMGEDTNPVRLSGHTLSVAALTFSPDGKSLASASIDTTVRLWDPTNGQELAVLRRHHNAVRALAFSPDGRVLASGSEGSTGRDQVLLWRAGE